MGRLSPGHSPSPLSRSAPSEPTFEPRQRPSRSNPPPRRAYPPAPRVDDEDIILGKEYGTVKLAPPEEDANSRGEVDQNPVIMDVHEFNPERRFVIIDDETKPRETPEEVKVDRPSDETTKPIPTEPRQPNNDEGRLKPEAQSAPALSSQPRRPVFERRRSSRQDLPTLDTELGDRREAEHHRSKSAVNGPRPDYFSPRTSRQFGDNLLSPDVIKHGSNGREQSYYVPASERDAYSARDRPRDSRSADTARRSSPNVEQGEFRRPVSNDRSRTSRTRDEAPYASYDTSRSSRHTSRESSQPKEEPASGRRSPSFQKPIIIQNGRPHEAPERIVNERLQRHRSPSRSNTTPLPASTKPVAPEKVNSDTKPPNNKRSETTSGAPLPYPEEDVSNPSGRGRGGAYNGTAPFAPVYMPQIPNVAPEVVASPTVASMMSPPPTPASQRNTWKPQSFNPDRDGQPQRPFGTYRRYSEDRDRGQGKELPECPRINPVSGKMDWLTLPRSNFNICPECYGSVFADTEYRTHFQPMLRPTTEALSCDFGSSPWYRIAWLLILKQQAADLRLFHDMAHLMHVAKETPCPEYRKSMRTWYTVKDPTSRKAVPEFTVCYQCAKTVETLLPNLSGVFVPWDSKAEPSKSTCALHFAPDRREFVLFFDVFETTAERAAANKRTANVSDLTKNLERLTTHNACREDRPVSDGYWHYMQYLPQFTVCGDCFEDVVKPRLGDDNLIARNFYVKPQKIPVSTCQLYSSRMRSIFKKACQRNDPVYLEERVRERMRIEADIHGQLVKLDQRGKSDSRTEEHVDRLIREWKKWE